MRGKNTGKKAPLPPRESAKLPPRTLLKKPPESDCLSNDKRLDVRGFGVPRSLGAELAYFTFPVEVDAQMAYLIRRCKLVPHL